MGVEPWVVGLQLNVLVVSGAIPAKTLSTLIVCLIRTVIHMRLAQQPTNIQVAANMSILLTKSQASIYEQTSFKQAISLTPLALKGKF